MLFHSLCYYTIFSCYSIVSAIILFSHACDRHTATLITFYFRPPTPHPPWQLFVDCLTSQQHASVSQGRICQDNFMCCHTEIETADPTFYLTQSQYTDTGPTSPSTDPIMPGAWYDSTWKNPIASGIRTPDLRLLRRTP